MLRKSTNRNNYLNDNLCHIRVNKRSNDERNSPRLSHQANNYFYNTKINRLILQEIPNNNVHNVYQEYQENKNISTEYDILHRNTSYLNKSKNDIYQLDITRIKKNNNYRNKDIKGSPNININNNSNNNSYYNIFYKNKLNDKNNNSNSMRDINDIRNSNIHKKISIKKNPLNNRYIKSYNIRDISQDNINEQMNKNIKNKIISPEIIFFPAKSNNDFIHKAYNSGQEFYKKKSFINKLNSSGYILYKQNPINNKSIESFNRNNNIYDNSMLEKKLNKFCDILEEAYFISFKNSFHYFIQNIISFIKNKKKSKNLILRRFDDISKYNNNKDYKVYNTMVNIESKNDKKYENIYNQKNNIESYIEVNKNCSSPKITEFQNNLTNSMIKMNHNKYINMLNNLFENDYFLLRDKRFRSPLIDRTDIQFNDNSFKSSFENCNTNDKRYSKYNTKTNINNLFQKKIYNRYNNLKINTEFELKRKHFINQINSKSGLYANINNLNKSIDIGKINNKDIYSNNRQTCHIRTRKNSCINKSDKKKDTLNSIINKSEKKANEQSKNIKNSILYSKPLLKKSTDKFLNKNDIFTGNNIIYDIQSKRKNIKSKIIIIKNIKTSDERIFINIRYIPIEYDTKWIKREIYYQNDIYISHTDSIKFIKKNINFKKNRKNKSNINYLINKYIEDNNLDNIYSNDNIKNAIKYLISLLQNIYNENKKNILFLFFKNLNKIKRESMLFSMKLKEKNYKKLSKNQTKNKIKNNNLLYKSADKTRNRKENNINNNINNNTDEISLKLNFMNLNRENYNKNILINLNEKENNKFTNIFNDKQENLNDNVDENDKEKIQKKKLAKLSKIFNNLNKENNIINSIKEQFLDWTNKNEIHNKPNIDKNKDDTKQNNNKIFDDNFINTDIEEENYEKHFEDKIKKFRLRLILISLKNKAKKYNKKRYQYCK